MALFKALTKRELWESFKKKAADLYNERGPEYSPAPICAFLFDLVTEREAEIEKAFKAIEKRLDEHGVE